MGANPRTKGRRAEFLARDLLQAVNDEVGLLLGIDMEKVDRNLVQTRGGGFDLIGTYDFAVEVKHHETPDVKNWWNQALQQAGSTYIPVLMYKSNNKPFKVRTIMGYTTPDNRSEIRCAADISLENFLLIYKHHLLSILGESNAHADHQG